MLINNLENLKLEREMLDIENENNDIHNYLNEHPELSVPKFFEKVGNNKKSSEVTLFNNNIESLYGRWDSTSKDLITLGDNFDNNLSFGEFTIDYDNLSGINVEESNDNKLSSDDLQKFLEQREKELDELFKK